MILIGFLRDVNVGGHHKVPMADLHDKLIDLGCHKVSTLMNIGNFVFETKQSNIKNLENNIESYLSQTFGFPIPVILKNQKEISDLVVASPFATINIHNKLMAKPWQNCYVQQNQLRFIQ